MGVLRAIAVAAALGWGPAMAGSVAPELQAASNFGQTWDPVVFEAARAAGITRLRDEIHWDFAERDGTYVYDHPILSFPEQMAEAGMTLTLIAQGGHPDHDAGVTPHSAEAVAGFAAFFADAAARFPAVTAVEVGNEMNSETFTAGPAREADIAGRAGYYAALLAATAAAVRAERPEIRVLGGAAHSIPLAWFDALGAEVAAQIDAVALHPYTTAPEQLRRQMALLRARPGYAALPLELTEIGTPDAAAAPALLARSLCQGALAGATTLAWYPLSPRGDGYAPLLEADGRLTAVGRSWQVLREFEGLAVTDAAPDAFTYGCRFGDRALMLWGAPRTVRLGPGVEAIDLAGAPVAAPVLGPEPVLLRAAGGGLRLGETVVLGPVGVVADSFDQFSYDGFDASAGFDRFVRVGDQRVPWVLAPGQQEPGVPWTPYLTTARDGWLRMDAEMLQPSVWPEGPAEIVHAFRAPEAMRLRLRAWLGPATGGDGVRLTVRQGARVVAEAVAAEEGALEERDLVLAAGERVEIVTGPGATAGADARRYRFTLERVD